MPLIDKRYDVEEKCRCGRRMFQVHCTDCGSLNVIRRPQMIKETAVDKSGAKQEMYVYAYHCRRCGLDFTEVNRYMCEAPAVQLSMKAQRVEDEVRKAVDLTDKEQRMGLLKDLFGNKNKKKED